MPATTTHIAGAEHANAGGDRLGAVADLLRARRSDENFGADRLRPLGARIVVGDDDDVRLLHRDGAHDRPLAFVAVAAAAHDADELAGGERAQRIEHGGERFGLVRVVDDGKAAARFADDLQPPFDAL